MHLVVLSFALIAGTAVVSPFMEWYAAGVLGPAAHAAAAFLRIPVVFDDTTPLSVVAWSEFVQSCTAMLVVCACLGAAHLVLIFLRLVPTPPPPPEAPSSGGPVPPSKSNTHGVPTPPSTPPFVPPAATSRTRSRSPARRSTSPSRSGSRVSSRVSSRASTPTKPLRASPERLLPVVVSAGPTAAETKWAAPDRTHYIVANLLKSFCLAAMCTSPPLVVAAYRGYVSESAVTSIGSSMSIQLKQYVALYIATDAYALAVVPALPFTTLVHHILTTLMGLYVFASDLTLPSSIASMMCWYGVCSSFAYAVNALLALRFRYGGQRWCDFLSTLSLVIYAVACAANWSLHVSWTCRWVTAALTRPWSSMVSMLLSETLPRLLYMTAVLGLVRDDLILMGWLYHRNWGVGIDGKKDGAK